MRYRLTISYDGTDYAGWQRQRNARTVQAEIETALKKITDQDLALQGSGRTDSGVHAAGQVAHVDIEKDFSDHRLLMALNAHLRDQDIKILHVSQVDDSFHARFSAVKRFYTYRIINRRTPPVFLARYAWHIPRPLNLVAMQQAARYLIGTHDFSAFRAAGCGAKTPNKTLDRLTITSRGDVIDISFEARSFLYHQVRLTVGPLVLVGQGKHRAQHLQDVLHSRSHAQAGPTAPARGLCLVRVAYLNE